MDVMIKKLLMLIMIDFFGYTKVLHACGAHVGYVKDKNKMIKDADNFVFLTGESPKPSDVIAIPCSKCGIILRHRDIADLKIESNVEPA